MHSRASCVRNFDPPTGNAHVKPSYLLCHSEYALSVQKLQVALQNGKKKADGIPKYQYASELYIMPYQAPRESEPRKFANDKKKKRNNAPICEGMCKEGIEPR